MMLSPEAFKSTNENKSLEECYQIRREIILITRARNELGAHELRPVPDLFYRFDMGLIAAYQTDIAVMPVIDLPEDSIEGFTDQVTPLFRMIGANKTENSRLASVRDALLPKLMSGELEVSDLDL